jgi:hypothetical protein
MTYFKKINVSASRRDYFYKTNLAKTSEIRLGKCFSENIFKKSFANEKMYNLLNFSKFSLQNQ